MKNNIVTKALAPAEKLACYVKADYLPPSPAIRQKFLDLKYPALWRRNEKRFLPPELVAEIMRRGDTLFICTDNEQDMRESFIPLPANHGRTLTPADYAAKYAGLPLIKVVCLAQWSSGDFVHDFAVFGYPAIWRTHEIREIPEALYLKLNSGRLSTEPEHLNRWAGIQLKFKVVNDKWRAEQVASQQKAMAQFEAERAAAAAAKERRRRELGI